MAENIVLTQEGYDTLIKELDHLKKVKRPEISKAIGAARELGDLRENGEYESARHAQALLEDRIKELEDKLSRVKILQKHLMPEGKVCLGTSVTVRNTESGEQTCYTLVGQDEANLEKLKISITSPIAKALLGKEAGNEVEARVPAGIKKFKIISIKSSI